MRSAPMRSGRVWKKAAARRPARAAKWSGPKWLGAKWLGVTVWTGAGLGLATTLIGWLSFAWWVFGLFEHFRVQIAVASVLVAVVAALRRSFAPAALAALAVTLNLVAIAPAWMTPELPAHHGDPLKVVVLNVMQDNPDHARVARFLAESDADIVGLLEVDSAWLRDLAPTMARWKYQQPHPRNEDKFGLALYSKRPFQFREVRTFGVPWPPAITARIVVDGAPVTFVLVHPPPPVSAKMAEAQRASLDALADARASLGEHVVVMGDLNATPWSYALRRLRKRTGLADSRRGFGLEPSWPSSNPVLRIPIDQVLVSPRIVVLGREVGPAVGSDHFPVIARLALVR
jgi:endonuclease/exonuclease/phosphatase (EEP) superfamily protein YafD